MELRNKIFITLSIIGWSLFSCCSLAFAQDAQFSVSVDQNAVSTDQQFTLELTLTSSGSTNGQNLKLPELSKFLILSGPNQSTRMQIINGSVSSSQTFSYIVQPREAGKFIIGSATIDAGGKQYRSQPIEITVTKGSGHPVQQSQNAPSAEAVQIGDNLLLRASIDRSRVYQGEQITVNYKIYTSFNLVNLGVDKMPSMTGFWGEDLPVSRQINFTNETVNGKQYRVGIVKKMALFPTQSGTLELSPMELTCQVKIQRRGRSGDIFDQFFNDPFFGGGQTVNVPVKSSSVKISVLPLPGNNIPASFKGAVGIYSLKASLSKGSAKTNEPISLKATVSGTGNVKVLEAPLLTLPQDFEKYDPKITEDISRDGAAVSGSKSFEWLLIPRYPGQKTIPALEFSYFDVNQKRYITLHTNEFNVLVEKGNAEASSVAGGFSKEDVKLLNQDIRFIKTESGKYRLRNGESVSPGLFTVLTLLPLAAFIGLLFYKRKEVLESADVVQFRSRRALKLAAKRLKDANALRASNNTEAFYMEISRALWQYVSDKLSIDQAELSIDTVTQKLLEKNIHEEFIARLKLCLETCEYARFAPASSSSEEKQKMYETASSIIVAAGKELL
jgi:hypothetical protein